MKFFIASLLCAAIGNADFMGGRTQFDPAHLVKEVFDGKAAYRGEHKYIASLQLNGSHTCSSGMFRMGFLLTTVECAWQLGKAIKNKEQRATAVFANPNLKDGQRINIYKVAYCFRYKYFESDVGVIMLVNNYDHTSMGVLHLYPKKIDLRRRGPEASVCGWATDNPPNNVEFKEVKFSDNLHCVTVKLHGEGLCQRNIPFGNYRSELLCGRSDSTIEMPTVEDLGSPVTKIIYNDDKYNNLFLGVAIQPFVHENITFHRSIRISFVFKDIQEMVTELKAKTKADTTYVRKN